MRTTLLLVSIALLLDGCAKRRLPTAVPASNALVQTQYIMRYAELKIGTGPLAEPGKVYVLHYTGWLWDGTKFDSSRDRNQPFSFEQGKRKTIPGFDNGFEGMHVGGQRRLFLPYQLAYGEKGRGKIPAKADLIFDIELLGVQDPPPAP